MWNKVIKSEAELHKVLAQDGPKVLVTKAGGYSIPEKLELEETGEAALDRMADEMALDK